MKPSRVLVVGCGSIGLRHLRLLNERDDCNVSACDPRKEAQKDVAGIDKRIACFTDLKEALQEQPEIVVVASPNEHHCDAALAALRAGAHVLCEKPLGRYGQERQTDVMKIFDCNREGYRTLTFERVRDNYIRAEHQDMFDAVRTGRSPKVDGRAGLEVLEIAEKAIRQTRRG